MIANQVMPSTWTYFTKLRFGWSEATIGVSLATAGLVMATSQATLLRFLVPRFGERRAALTGITIACIGQLGYATATASWVMFAWLGTWFFGAIVMPSSNALLSRRLPVDAQGELQGAVACLMSLSAIVGPPLMTQLFGRCSSPTAAVYFPGAAFLAAAILIAISGTLFWAVTREPAGRGLAEGR